MLSDAGFARKDVLENHVVSVHGVRRAGHSWEVQPERKKTETCEECGASFYDKLVFLYVILKHKSLLVRSSSSVNIRKMTNKLIQGLALLQFS